MQEYCKYRVGVELWCCSCRMMMMMTTGGDTVKEACGGITVPTVPYITFRHPDIPAEPLGIIAKYLMVVVAVVGGCGLCWS